MNSTLEYYTLLKCIVIFKMKQYKEHVHHGIVPLGAI